jgi:A/G-specific adenine glycosylase
VASTISASRRRSFARRLLDWYAANGRDLPWRHTSDPYAILVCEILSHQTQLARVVPVYQEILRRYPTVEAMAAVPLDSIKGLTDPLGYKVRGRWLHSAALQVRDAGGRFPNTLEGMRRLPGVGRYTAAAVMSFAYHTDVPLVDTNVSRVLSRHFIGRAQIPSAGRIWALAADVIPPGRGHLLNQALMDLGAMVCRARTPQCARCPVRRSCSYRLGHSPTAMRIR